MFQDALNLSTYAEYMREFIFDDYEPPAMSLDEFWEAVAQVGWGERIKTAEEGKAFVVSTFSFAQSVALFRHANELVYPLSDALEEAMSSGRLTVAEGTDEEALYQVCEHVVGLGREVFERESVALEALASRAERGDLLEGFHDLFNPWNWLRTCPWEEIEAVLRRGAVIRAVGDEGGIANGELFDDPERGLGISIVERTSSWCWVIFPASEISIRRHDRIEREVTLYRDGADGIEYWFASLGGSPAGTSVFECTGRLGVPETPRFLDPRARGDATRWFEAREAMRRAEGFAARELPGVQIVVQLPGVGLLGQSTLRRTGLNEAAFALLETGNGRFARSQVIGDRANLFFEVHDPETAARAVSNRLRRALEGKVQPRIARIEGGEAQEIRPSGEGEPFGWGEAEPCRLGGEIPHLTRLTIHEDPETGSEAMKLAEAAVALAADKHNVTLDWGIESLGKVDGILGALRAALEAEGPEASSSELVRPFGCYFGEVLRRAVGGFWGRGLLFDRVIPFALGLGEGGLKAWPVREVHERLESSHLAPLSERAEALTTRVRKAAAQSADGPADAERLYPLGAGEGYFDAGVTEDGRQVLMAAFYTDTFAIFFDEAGMLLEYATREEIEDPPDMETYYGPSPAAMRAWQRDLGFEARTIRVRGFSIPDQGVGIAQMPGHYVDFLEDPDAETNPKERQQMMDWIQSWVENGEFVLYWGNDLWVDGEGHVTSS